MREHQSYLGDGVYASFDGFSVWLAVDEPENNVVALEPETFVALCKYVNRLKSNDGEQQ